MTRSRRHWVRVSIGAWRLETESGQRSVAKVWRDLCGCPTWWVHMGSGNYAYHLGPFATCALAKRAAEEEDARP